MKFFITPQELKEEIDLNKEIVILDCRGELADYSAGYRAYQEGHFEGAVFFDGEKLLTGEKKEHGGRHPLPDLVDFKKKIENFGLKRSMTIVAHGLYAGRALFMLRIIGFEKLKMLSGGIDSWLSEGYPTTKITKEYPSVKLAEIFKYDLILSMENTREIIKSKSKILVDCRSPERYQGINEPIDKIAGSIPGALNVFWKDSYEENSMHKIKSKDNLKEIWEKVISADKEIVLYCGSGVTATFNHFALLELGVESKIYSGSYSDWISYDENEIQNLAK